MNAKKGVIPLADIVQLCRDFSSRNGTVYIKDVEAALPDLADLYSQTIYESESAQIRKPYEDILLRVLPMLSGPASGVVAGDICKLLGISNERI